MPRIEIGPLELLILQGTPFCNIDCKYCYLPDRLSKDRMSIEIIRHTIEKLLKDDLIRDEFTVLWHAGEPLVLPVEYYEEVIRIIRNAVPKKRKVKFSIQTNGILINERWCQFFKNHNIELGISLDGPAFIHDQNRITRSGKGTLSKVMRGVDLLRKHNIPIDIIAVLTAFSCNYPLEIYDFLKTIGTSSVSFNVEEVVGANKSSSFSDSETSRKLVRKFLEKVFELNINDGEPIQIREYNWAKSALLEADLNDTKMMLSQMTGTYRTITVNTKGEFSTYSPELLGQQSTKYIDFMLGNVLHDSFLDALNTDKFKLIYSDLMKGLSKCKKNCSYYGLCPGGIPSSKLSEKQTFDADETVYCQLGLQAPIDALLEMVMEEPVINKIK